MSVKYEKHHLIPGKFPFKVNKSPFYYGWIALVAGSLGVLFSIPGQTMGVSVYTDHLIENLHLTRIEISQAYMIGTLISSLLITWAGLFYDKFGARVAAAASAFFLGFFLIFMSRSVELTGFFSESTGLSPKNVAFFLMVFGFLGIRFFGQGVLTLVSRGMVMRWFEENRGFAASLMGTMTTFGFSYAPRFLHELINLSSWERSWNIQGLVLIALIVPFIIIIFRDSPEDCGMEMEQGVKIKTAGKKKEDRNRKSYTLAEARRDPQLWFYIAILFFWALYNTAFTFHITSIFHSLGLNDKQAVAIFLPIAVISVIARFLASWISGIIKMKYIFYAMIISALLGSWALTMPWNTLTSYLLIGGMGLASGFFGSLISVTWPKLYGRKYLGAISGLAMSFMVAGSAIGPWIFSHMENIWGHYRHTGWFGVIFVSIIGLASLLVIPRAEKN